MPQQVGHAERRVAGLGGRGGARRGGRQQQRQRRQQHDARHADIEHPGRSVAVDGDAGDEGAEDEGHRAPHAHARIVEPVLLGLDHQHAVVERHRRRPQEAPDHGNDEDRQERIGELVGAHHHDGADAQRHDDAARPAQPVGDPADRKRGDHRHDLARHEQRADLGVADAAVAQPHRPVAHEGAGGEEVGGAIGREPHPLEEAARRPVGHQAANSLRIASLCWPSVGTSPSRSGSPV